MIDILLMITVISLWCCGFRAITGEGMILYFLRQPFESKDGVMNLFQPHIERYKKRNHQPYPDVYLDRTKRRTEVLKYIMKPFILCVTCMSSIHGTFIYWWISPVFDPQVWLISIICAAFVNSISWMSFEKLSE